MVLIKYDNELGLKGQHYFTARCCCFALHVPYIKTNQFPAGASSTQPPLCKQEYNRCDMTISLLWIRSSDVLQDVAEVRNICCVFRKFSCEL